MRKYLILFLLSGFALNSCNNDPEPELLPDEIRSYVTLYNFLLEPFNVVWEVDDIEVQDEHIYGTIIPGGVLLEGDSANISFVVKNASTHEILESQVLNMIRDKNYIMIIFGSAENPTLLFHKLETTKPGSGNMKVQFLHATEYLDSLDVYVGGSTPEKKFISGIAYGDLTSYNEVSEYDIRSSVIITPHEPIYKPGNDLLSYEYNDLLKVNGNYLTVIAPSYTAPPFELTLWLYVQAMD